MKYLLLHNQKTEDYKRRSEEILDVFSKKPGTDFDFFTSIYIDDVENFVVLDKYDTLFLHEGDLKADDTGKFYETLLSFNGIIIVFSGGIPDYDFESGILYLNYQLFISNLAEYLNNPNKMCLFVKKEKAESALSKEIRILQLEKMFKHDLANEFGAVLFAGELHKNGHISKAALDYVFEIFLSKKEVEKRPVIKEYLELKEFENLVNFTGTVNNNVNKHNLNVLFIDDNSENGWSIIFSEMFTNLTVLKSFNDFSSYFDKLDSEKEYIPFDMIILDLNLKNENHEMPITERSGYQALKMIRKKDLLIPVIVLTGSEKAKNMEELKNEGIEAYVSKIHPGMTDDEIDRHVAKFMESLAVIHDNKYIHSLWKVHNLMHKYLKNKKKDSILVKYKTCIYKLYDRQFRSSRFKSNLQSYEYNEVLIYLHSILTDLLIEKKETIVYYDENERKWKNFVARNIDDNPSFGKIWINEKNFSNEIEREILNKMNSMRNKIKPIHGNQVLKRDDALFFTVVTLYELSKNDPFLKSNVFKAIQEVLPLAKFSVRKGVFLGVKELNELWEK